MSKCFVCGKEIKEDEITCNKRGCKQALWEFEAVLKERGKNEKEVEPKETGTEDNQN